MKKLSGMDVAYKIRENSLRTQIVFITVMLEYAPEGYIVQAFRYIMKDKLSQLLPECLTEILKGYKNQIQMMEFPFKGNCFILRVVCTDWNLTEKEICFIYIRH